MDTTDYQITEPLCANQRCKYHRYIVGAWMNYVQVIPEPTKSAPVVSDKTPNNVSYDLLTIERVPLFKRNVKIGMYCVNCAKELINDQSRS